MGLCPVGWVTTGINPETSCAKDFRYTRLEKPFRVTDHAIERCDKQR